ncbi:MAG TPA: EF-hand domain-containing protein [Chthoniobacterales bacterium]
MKITTYLLGVGCAGGLFAGCAMTPKRAADSRITLAQFVQSSPGGRITRNQFVDWNVARLFKIYDRNGDGVVDRQELRAVQGADQDNTFRRLDRYPDEKITLAEATADAQVRRAMGATFKDVDINHDGTIDVKEATAYAQKRQRLTP